MLLKLEKYVFEVLENQKRLYDFLGPFEWGLDTNNGRLTFNHYQDQGLFGNLLSSQKKPQGLIAQCLVQFIGTESDQSKTWLWSWANKESQLPKNLTEDAETVRQQAEKENNTLFTKPKISASKVSPIELAIISTGFLKHFTYFTCSYEGGALYVSIKESPISHPSSNENSLNATLVLGIIQLGISNLSFNHKEALINYLGDDYEKKEQEYVWILGEEKLIFKIDDQDRISSMKTTLSGKW